jgi:hypothetical protein
MHKLDLTIVRLKLLLAELNGKREAMATMRQQYEDQIRRLVDVTVYEDSGVDRSLGMMMDVDARLQEISRQEHYLELVHVKARRELDSLQLTKLVEETRAQLASLRQRQSEQDAGDSVESAGAQDSIAQEIRRLEEIITAASGAAAKSISAHHAHER